MKNLSNLLISEIENQYLKRIQFSEILKYQLNTKYSIRLNSDHLERNSVRKKQELDRQPYIVNILDKDKLNTEFKIIQPNFNQSYKQRGIIKQPTINTSLNRQKFD